MQVGRKSVQHALKVPAEINLATWHVKAVRLSSSKSHPREVKILVDPRR